MPDSLMSEVDSMVGRAESLLRSKDYAAAAAAAEAVLRNLSLVSKAAVIRGNALLFPLLDQIMDGSRENPNRAAFQEAEDMFVLARKLDPENEVAGIEEQNMKSIIQMLLPGDDADLHEIHHASDNTVLGKKPQVSKQDDDLDVVIVGAGASGVGVGLMLIEQFGIDRKRMLVLERGARVGESFRRWPKEMRFISPSFNQAEWTKSLDLNSIAQDTSPAKFLLEEHPTGEQYANYLEAVANESQLPIQFCTDVTRISPLGVPGHPRFKVHVKPSQVAPAATLASVHCKFVIWAAGEFQYPKDSGGFQGMELCQHNSFVRSWVDVPGDEFVVIGGYESGIDAAVQLARTKRPVTVLAASPCWQESSPDPSEELAPYTRARLRDVMTDASLPQPKLHGGFTVTKVAKADAGYLVYAKEHAADRVAFDDRAPVQRIFSTASPPILCVGFQGSVAALVGDLFQWSSDKASSPVLTDQDESTRTEGFFLVGPSVCHDGLIFCFVYKFRQRFAVVAEAVARRLGKDTHQGIMACRSADMFLDDLAGIHACTG
ncbi:unnamed protein product [Symbiodinium sp. CCMP2456]|nr:unnamed protein product [Symbiodinium sp. CCMP2456]